MFPYDRFVKFEELTTLLRNAAESHPNLARVASIGSSHEGRSIWCVTVTNYATGEPLTKPAFYVDANIHATELSGSVAAFKLIDTLLSNYGKRGDITRLLDTRTIYVIPRVNPDGAEWAMADKPKYIRSSTRPYPYNEDAIEGLEAEDIDGDGRILMMRISDVNGPWKKHATETRLMVRRDPVETGGEYFRIVSEGRIKNYDGFNLPVARPKTGLDLNRNFPEEWRGEGEQLGAGDFPTSEPEVRDAWSSSTNTAIFAAACSSTHGVACCCGRSAPRPMTKCRPRICGCSRRRATRAPSSPVTRRSAYSTSSNTIQRK